MTRLGVLSTIALLTLTACDQAGRVAGNAIFLGKAIPELPYSGDRPDAPPLEERGNSVFTGATFDATGKLLVTIPWFGSARLQVWDVEAGAIISGFDAIVPGPGSKNIWMLDSARRRLFARNGQNDGFALFDLMTGATISEIADTDDGGGRAAPPPAFREPYAVGLTADGTQALIFKPGAMELWDVAPPAPEGGPGPARLAKRAISPFTPQRFFPTCVGGAPGSTYNDKQCWEWSPDRRVLAVAYTPEEPINALTQHLLIGIDDLEIERLEVPGPASRSFTSFAFSPDNQWLALGNSGGMWLYDRAAKEWARWIPGDHKRNRALAPMRFTSDSSRVIALGDQLQISVYDVGTGSMAGRHDPTFENWEGELKLSADGSRIVVYKFLSDTFEVLDGSDAKRLGWVCPYFCNVRHNPVQPGYAVSPDGRSVAISHRRGAAVWNTATDTMRFALRDPKRKPLPYPMQR